MTDRPIRETGPLNDVLIGDRLSVAGRVPCRVETIFLCHETLGGVGYNWRWLFLDDGTLVEVAPKGLAVYTRHQIVPPGSALFAELVAPDGALVRFEERVQDGSVQARPVRVSLEGRAD